MNRSWGDEAGRLVFTPRSVTSNKPRRYAIGDVGQWMLEAQGACPCGRSAPRFRLLGRTGDVFPNWGSFFLNFRKFTDILSNIAGYAGDLQIQLDEAGLKERLTLRVSRGQGLTAETARQLCLDHYGDLHEAVTVDGTLVFEVEELSPEEFKRSPSSGKLLGIVDAEETRMKKVETKVLTELIQFVRVHSPFYRELYSDLPPNETTLERLPLIPHARFWQANTYEGNQLLTGPIPDGIILKSGGTDEVSLSSRFLRVTNGTSSPTTFASKLGLTGLVDGESGRQSLLRR